MLSFGVEFRNKVRDSFGSGHVQLPFHAASFRPGPAIAPRSCQTRVPKLIPTAPKLSFCDPKPKPPAADPELEPRSYGHTAFLACVCIPEMHASMRRRSHIYFVTVLGGSRLKAKDSLHPVLGC